jgi:hypothetical protein
VSATPDRENVAMASDATAESGNVIHVTHRHERSKSLIFSNDTVYGGNWGMTAG